MARVNDYVIVGAGAAGCVLASRLSEDPDCRVLLLEAGRDTLGAQGPSELRMPSLVQVLQPTLLDEYFWRELQALRNERQTARPFLRGRAVGGSSLINGAIALRGLPEDYDRWSEMGCTGWSAQDVHRFVADLEYDLDNHRDNSGEVAAASAPGAEELRGRLPISRRPRTDWSPLSKAFAQAAHELGYPWSEDANAADSSGISPIPMNVRDGRKVPASDAYLKSARKRENLQIRANALVAQVCFDGRRAVGVEVIQDGCREIVRGREILLCAGAVHSPAILQRSGVGDSDRLAAVGIEPHHSLPGVGQNLLDHPFVVLKLDLRPTHRARSLSVPWADVCVRYSSNLAGGGRNDMLMMAASLSAPQDVGIAGGSVSVCLFEAFSQGELAVRSADPVVEPTIRQNLLADERDLVRLRDGVHRLLELCSQPAMVSAYDTVRSEAGTPLELGWLRDRAELDDWLLAQVGDAFHIAGTCRMGAPGEPIAVVDPLCRVQGLDGLRVIDASVMPAIPRANTQLPTLMIAEKMSAYLRVNNS